MRTYVGHLEISKKPVGNKNEFSKNIRNSNMKVGSDTRGADGWSLPLGLGKIIRSYRARTWATAPP